MIRIAAAAATVAAMAAPALADEVWSTPYGDVIYEADIGDVAVLSFPAGGNSRANFYFPGLGGNFSNRSVHRGYWVDPAGGDCGAAMTGPDGLTSDGWGRTVIAFDGAAFPTAFTALAGECWAEPTHAIRAEPVTAQ